MDSKIIMLACIIVVVVSIFAIILTIAIKNRAIRKVMKTQRIAPGSVRNNSIWVDPDDPIYANEDDEEPIGTIGELINCNLPESRFLEVIVQFHAADDKGRLRIQTDTGYVWLEPINQKASYTIPINQ